MIGKLKYGPYIALVIAIKNILNSSFYNGIAKLANANKGVEVRLANNTKGNFKTYLEWDKKRVRYRSGSSSITTEKTTIEWSSTK